LRTAALHYALSLHRSAQKYSDSHGSKALAVLRPQMREGLR
jgi:hypothetical protein